MTLGYSAMVKSLICSVIAGAIGAGAWAALGHFANIELGWLAIGVGFLCGLGAMVGADGEGEAVNGVIAVIVTVLAIVAGKWLMVSWAFAEGLDEQAMAEIRSEASSRDSLVATLAYEIAGEREANGEALEWPDGYDDPDLPYARSFPDGIWDEATEAYRAMSQEERDDLVRANLAEAEEMVAMFMGEFGTEAKIEAFKSMFGVMDLLFFGIGAFAAFRMGASGFGDRA